MGLYLGFFETSSASASAFFSCSYSASDFSPFFFLPLLSSHFSPLTVWTANSGTYHPIHTTYYMLHMTYMPGVPLCISYISLCILLPCHNFLTIYLSSWPSSPSSFLFFSTVLNVPIPPPPFPPPTPTPPLPLPPTPPKAALPHTRNGPPDSL